jgi:hypothetical protein
VIFFQELLLQSDMKSESPKKCKKYTSAILMELEIKEKNPI